MDLSLDQVSQLAHVAWGALLVIIITHNFHTPLEISAPLVGTVTGAKEYWDCHGLEDPAFSGGIAGSWKDWGFWCLGVLLGCAILKFN